MGRAKSKRKRFNDFVPNNFPSLFFPLINWIVMERWHYFLLIFLFFFIMRKRKNIRNSFQNCDKPDAAFPFEILCMVNYSQGISKVDAAFVIPPWCGKKCLSLLVLCDSGVVWGWRNEEKSQKFMKNFINLEKKLQFFKTKLTRPDVIPKYDEKNKINFRIFWGPSKRCPRRKRKFFYCKIDWHWALVVCDEWNYPLNISISIADQSQVFQPRTSPLTTKNWFKRLCYQFHCRKILFSICETRVCLEKWRAGFVDKHSDMLSLFWEEDNFFFGFFPFFIYLR